MIKTSTTTKQSSNKKLTTNSNQLSSTINRDNVVVGMLQQPIIKQNNSNNNDNTNTNIKFTQQQFMKYYQQNIRMRRQLQQKGNYINDLRAKLQHQLGMNRTVVGNGNSNNIYNQLKQLKKQVKKQGNNNKYNNYKKSNNNSSKGFNNSSQSGRKLQNLLQIIESYKQKLLISQEQCANLKRQKMILEQDAKVGCSNNNNINSSNNNNRMLNSSQYQRQHNNNNTQSLSKCDELLVKLRQKTSQLQLQKQRNKFVQAELRRLQSKQRQFITDEEEIQQLKVENRVLEERIMRLTLITDSSEGGNGDYRALQEKCRELEIKLMSGLQKYNKLKQQKMRIDIDYKLIQNKLVQVQHDLQTVQQQNVTLKKNEINDPVIQRLVKDKLLLARVIGEIQSCNYDDNNFNNSNTNTSNIRKKKQHSSFQSTQKLLLQKQSLARQLIQTKSKMRLLQQSWRDKEAMIRIQKEDMLMQIGQQQQYNTNANNANNNNINNNNKNTKTNTSYTSKQGVQYDGDITMFSDERTTTITNTNNNTNNTNNNNINYFDIYLGRVNLIQSLVKAITPLTISAPLLMATVDFYNFPTENTKLSQGMTADFNTQFVFKVVEQEFFYKFLLKNSLKLSIWATEGNKNYLIGQVDLPLKQLVMRNRINIAPVINTSAPIINGQKVVGTIFFDMRMRLPIYEQTSKIISQQQGVSINSDNSNNNKQQTQQQSRKLIIQIDEGRGFKQQSKLFVYYQFRLQDYYTRTSPGPVPKWGHYKMIELRYDQQIKNYLRRNQLQVTVFDDSVGLDERDGDVVGVGVVSLLGLVEDKVVREKVLIRKNGVVSGEVEIKLFWYQSTVTKDNNNYQQQQQSLLSTATKQQKTKPQLLQSLHNDILQHINTINSTEQRQFKKIDSNSTGMVSFDQFNMWVIRIKQSHKYSRQIISLYYDTFQQPLNLLNWIGRMQSQRRNNYYQQGNSNNTNYNNNNNNNNNFNTKYTQSQIQLMPQLSKINQLLKKNSVQIDTRVTLREYLKDKNMFNVTLDIDANGNGEISRQELIDYMNRHNVVVDQKEIQGDSVNLVSFLKKYGK